MRIGIIGTGAIGRFVYEQLTERGFDIAALLVRDARQPALAAEFPALQCVTTVAGLPDDIDQMIDCAGHGALREHGREILCRGIDLTTVSIGALADTALFEQLDEAAQQSGASLILASGAIGALDCLRAARIGTLTSVTYVGRKPPAGWRGSPAESKLDLDDLTGDAAVHFEGSARDAALQYPKNANVAAAVALAGVGFDDTTVRLVADPSIEQNIHEVIACGDFGECVFEIRGNALPTNPKSSALAAMSVVSQIEQASRRIRF